MKRPQKGFSLVELLIVVTIILIIAAMVIPNLLRSKIAANDSSAVASLRNINTAEVTYQSTWGIGFAANLTNLGGASPCAVATSAAACIIDPLLSVAPNTKSGYVFAAAGTIPIAGINNGFEVNATPGVVQVTGVRAFCADQTGLIQFVTPGPAPIGLAAGTCAAVPNVPGTSGPVN
jgi:prepilin-type N-terminal cleavage/methylation domain-containing protein